MQCPKCGLTVRVKGTEQRIIKGTVYLVQTMTCDNPKCLNGGKATHEIVYNLATGEREKITDLTG